MIPIYDVLSRMWDFRQLTIRVVPWRCRYPFCPFDGLRNCNRVILRAPFCQGIKDRGDKPCRYPSDTAPSELADAATTRAISYRGIGGRLFLGLPVNMLAQAFHRADNRTIMTQNDHIAIVGAGIGGLAAAAALAQAGYRIVIYDQFDQARPVGSGLVIQPVGLTVLRHIGAGDAALALGTRIHRMLGHEARGGHRVLDVHYDRPGGARFGLGIHRAALFQVLLDAAINAGAELVTGHRVTGQQNRKLSFSARQDAGPFRMIIDASGASSPLSQMRARPLGYGALWATVDWPETGLPRDELRQIYRKASHMLGVLPVGTLPGSITQKAAIFWSLPASSYQDWCHRGIAQWQTEATALWPDYAAFAQQVTTPDHMTMARYSHGTLRKPWGDGVVHIGDSAHRASPQLGQGANMALLDAWALATALQEAGGNDDRAMKLYASARRWHVRVYQAMSWAFTPQYQSDSQMLPLLRDRLFFPMSLVPPIPAILSRLVCGDLLPPAA